MTPLGAKVLKDEMAKCKPVHWDACVWQVGCTVMNNQSCYVYPPVGNYQTHFSGTIDEERPNQFKKKSFVGQRVIPGKKDWPRQLCKLIDQKGVFEVVGTDCVFEDWAPRWWTCRPPSSPYDDSGLLKTMLTSYGWLNHNGSWIGPAKGKSRKGDKGGPKSSHEELRRHPEQLLTMAGDESPVAMFAAYIVTDFPAPAWALSTEKSSRYWQARRRDIANYKCRVFTDFTYKARSRIYVC